jgi:hypothetical protein
MNTLTRITTALIAIGFVVTQTGCGTLTGLPAHGGGKRFATEQRLVSASIRSALKDIDVSPLRGKRVAVVFDIVADEGGGTMSGGRMNILGALTSGYLMSPVIMVGGGGFVNQCVAVCLVIESLMLFRIKNRCHSEQRFLFE